MIANRVEEVEKEYIPKSGNPEERRPSERPNPSTSKVSYTHLLQIDIVYLPLSLLPSVMAID